MIVLIHSRKNFLVFKQLNYYIYYNIWQNLCQFYGHNISIFCLILAVLIIKY